MKIYRKIRIDIDTGETLEEDSFEYDGPIAECGGGGEPSVQYSQSPQQAMMYTALAPLVQNMVASTGSPVAGYQGASYNPSAYGNTPTNYTGAQIPGQPGYVGDDSQLPAAYQGGTYLQGVKPISTHQPTPTESYPSHNAPTGSYPSHYAPTGSINQSGGAVQQPYTQQQGGGFLWNTPAIPDPQTPPSAQGIYSGVPTPTFNPYGLGGAYSGDIGGYNIPSVQNLMPTEGWYGGIAPEVMAGLEEPYNRARSQMFETLGAGGLSGSARAGFSGAAGAALGEFEANKASQLGMQAWQMTQPALQANYQAQLGLGRDVWGANIQQNQMRDTAQLESTRYAAMLNDALKQQAYQSAQQENLMDYQSQQAYNQQLQQNQMQQWAQQAEAVKFPYTAMPSMMGGTYSSPVVNQGSSAGSLIGTGIGGLGALGAGAPLFGPVGLGAMALGGALGGIF